MITASSLYHSIVSSGDYWYETRIKMGNNYYGESYIYTCKIEEELFSNGFSAGNCISSSLLLELTKNVVIADDIIVYFRACNSTQQSEWLERGHYFLDEWEDDDSKYIVTAYDKLAFTDEWCPTSMCVDMTDTAMVSAICTYLGITEDSRNTYGYSYTIKAPYSYTIREVLGQVASAYCGNWVMTNEGKLRLIKFGELPTETGYLVDSQGYAITFGGDRINV